MSAPIIPFHVDMEPNYFTQDTSKRRQMHMPAINQANSAAIRAQNMSVSEDPALKSVMYRDAYFENSAFVYMKCRNQTPHVEVSEKLLFAVFPGTYSHKTGTLTFGRCLLYLITYPRIRNDSYS